MAERAIETGNADELVQLLSDAVTEELRQRFEIAIAWQGYDINNVEAGRRYVQGMLGFVLYAHHLCEFVKGRKLGKNDDDEKHLEEENRRLTIINKARWLGHHHKETAV